MYGRYWRYLNKQGGAVDSGQTNGATSGTKDAGNPKSVTAGNEGSPEARKEGRNDVHAPPSAPPPPPTSLGPTKPKPLQNATELEKQSKLEDAYKKKELKQTSTGNQLTGRAVNGDMAMECPSAAKIVRIFTSSTFTDTMHERNELMKHAYPRVKTFCRKLGYEFQVVDMRWGVRDEATDDHMGTELCLKELKLCQILSTGPNFVSLLSHKYGYTPFPRTIEATEFESMMEVITDAVTKHLLEKWYSKDENAVPTAYILSSISMHLPGFLSDDDGEKKKAKTTWWDESDVMQCALEEAAQTQFDEESARKYVMSVTEMEVIAGLLNIEDQSKHCIWLKRNIEDIEQQESSYQLSRYIECTGPDEKWMKSRRMLKELKEDQMEQKLDASRILNYIVQWNADAGINPEIDESHKRYIDKMMSDFVANMTGMIETSMAERTKTDDPLIDECIQHIRFCQSKTEGFHGREDTLNRIKSYLTSQEKEPLVLHGTSGTGKTSIMAMVAKLAREWVSPTPAVVVRFIGTSPESSSLMPLLSSITEQIKKINNIPSKRKISELLKLPSLSDDKDEQETSSSSESDTEQDERSDRKRPAFTAGKFVIRRSRKDLNTLNKAVVHGRGRIRNVGLRHGLFDRINNEKQRKKTGNQMTLTEFELAVNMGHAPLIIILDSLDQLDPANDALSLQWLPNTFRANCKLIVSTLPEEQYGCFPALKTKIKSDNFIEVPVLPENDVSGIVDKWLDMRQRTLTANQRKLMIDAFAKYSTPLFLKLSFEEAVQWSSFAPPDTTVLQETVRSSIDHLFQRLEKLHGKILVSRALSYLTMARNGATESELEDILSCDDDVLNDVYMYWTPPIRRLPPLLLVRIRTDLSQYLVERGADRVRVLYWYHRQFIEAAEARYCTDKDSNLLIHSNLADFFAGKWSNGKKKPYVSANGEAGEEDRNVSAQPYRYDDNLYNIRALNCLTYHRTKAMDADQLREDCLANYEFLLMKLNCVPVSQIIEDYQFAKEHFPDDELINMIHEALLLSQAGLSYDPGQLAPQMIGRLEKNKTTEAFLQACRDYPQTIMLPTKNSLSKPGGQLVHKMAGHKSDVDMMNMSECGKFVLTVCLSEKEVMVWDVEKGKLLRTVNDVGQCTTALFCHGDEWTAFEMDKNILLKETHTGKRMFMVEMPIKNASPICVAGPNRDILLVFCKQMARIHDLTDNGKLLATVTHTEKMKFGPMSIPFGSKNLVAAVDDDQHFVTVLDLGTTSFYKKFKGYAKVQPQCAEYLLKVNALSITPDEKSVAYTVKFINEVVFADPKTGEKQRSFCYGEYNRRFMSPKFTVDGSMMYFNDSQWLRIFDVGTLKEIDALQHTKDLVAFESKDMRTVVTSTDDGNVCIWDRTRKKQVSDAMESVFNYTSSRFAEYLPNSRYIIGAAMKSTGDEEDEQDMKVVHIYDTLQDKIVKEIGLPAITGNLELVHVFPDSRRIMLSVRRKIMILDMEKAALKTTFQGHTAADNFTYLGWAVTDKNQLVVLSKGRMNVKVYDIATGKVSFIIKGGQMERLEHIATNKAGTIAACNTNEGPLYVFDLANKKMLYGIPHQKYGEYFAVTKLINEAGTHLLFTCDKEIPETNFNAQHLVVWDVNKQVEMFRLIDVEYETKYKVETGDRDFTAVVTAQFLDENCVIMECDDYIIRIFNYRDGTLLHRLSGHMSRTKLSIVDSAPYILSLGTMDEEDSLRLWERETFKCVATYTFDKSIDRAILSPDGNYFVSVANNPINVVRWHIHHGKVKFQDKNYPKLYQGEVDKDKVAAHTIELGVTETFAPEDGDPDSDPETDIETDIDDDNDEEEDDDKDSEETDDKDD